MQTLHQDHPKIALAFIVELLTLLRVSTAFLRSSIFCRYPSPLLVSFTTHCSQRYFCSEIWKTITFLKNLSFRPFFISLVGRKRVAGFCWLSRKSKMAGTSLEESMNGNIIYFMLFFIFYTPKKGLRWLKVKLFNPCSVLVLKIGLTHATTISFLIYACPSILLFVPQRTASQ